MCGLVGIVGHIDSTHERMFKLMLQLDTLRGADSTGMLQVSCGKTHSILKAVGTPWDLAELKKYDSFFTGWHHLLLGHNRSATRGSVSYHNAHPFERGDIVGAHNGTLTSTYNLDGHGKYDVDSEVVFHHMEINGPEDTVNKINGAFALTWYDKFLKTFNMVRNGERTLYYTLLNNGSVLAYASEPWMIIVAGLKVNINVDIKDIISLPVGEHVEVMLPKETHYSAANVKPLIINKYNYELFKPTYTNYNRSGGHQGTGPFPKTTTSTATTPTGTTGPTIDTTKKALPAAMETTKNNVVAGNFSGDRFSKPYRVTFEVTGYGTDRNNKSNYISGRIIAVDDGKMEDLPTTNVRIFLHKNKPDWQDMMSSPYYFEGKTKRYAVEEGGFFTVFIASIKELTDYVEDVEDVYEGFDGMPMTYDEFRKTYKDCHVCGDPLDPKDSGVAFLSATSCMCGSCAEKMEEYNLGGGL